MTAPVVLAREARLAALAAWDVPLLRGAVVTLAAVEDRLRTWRTRAGAVARALESGEAWSGPAARGAVRVVLELDAAAAAVHAGLSGSLAAFQRLAGEADAAQEHAARALALARDRGVDVEAELQGHGRRSGLLAALAPLTPAPDPAPVVAAVEAALEHAAAAASAARAAGDALDAVGIRGAAPPGFPALAELVRRAEPSAAPAVPHDLRPGSAARWWAGLSTGRQLLTLRAAPELVGGMDGLPAWARDRANRILLDRALRDPGLPDGAAAAARAVADRIGIEEAAGRPVQLHLLDLHDDEVALAVGDLDTAGAVALLVPGILTTPADDLDGLAGDAVAVAGAATAAAPALAVATVVWLGSRSPGTPAEILTRSSASRGGRALSAALDGMAAAHEAAGRPRPRTSILAHSYGTVVVDEAADEPGRLAADAVVLLGSPGMEPTGAAGLEVAEVYDAAAPADPVSWLGWFGMPTWAPRFGSTGMPGNLRMGHSDYYDPGFPTLGAIGRVVAAPDAG